jgi:hypothetical protein
MAMNDAAASSALHLDVFVAPYKANRRAGSLDR